MLNLSQIGVTSGVGQLVVLTARRAPPSVTPVLQVPTLYSLDIYTLRFIYTAGALGGQMPGIQITYQGAVLYQRNTSSPMVALSVVDFTLAFQSDTNAGAPNSSFINLPRLWLPPGASVAVFVVNDQVDDACSAMVATGVARPLQ